MTKYPFLASRVFNKPLLITQEKANAILAVLSPKMGFNSEVPIEVKAYSDRDRAFAGYSVNDGIAYIPVHGTLVARGDYLDARSGITGYNFIQRAFSTAQDDDAVRHILLEFSTAGGEVELVDGLGELIYNNRGNKPVTAIVNEEANSAGLWIASAADQVFITRNGSMGSLGVVMTHISMEESLENMGIAVTHIYAGDRKIDFSPFKALSDDAKAHASEHIATLYNTFAETVARNRGITVEQAKSTQAMTYMGQRAVDVGFADKVMSFDAVIGTIRKSLRSSFISAKAHNKFNGDKMSDDSIVFSQSDFDAQIAEAKTAAVKAERERIGAILSNEHAQGRNAMARTLAIDTDLSAEQAIKVLASAPVEATLESTQAKESSFERMMARMGNPPVEPDTVSTDEDPVEIMARAIVDAR